MTIYGELHIFKMEPFVIEVEPKIPSLDTLRITANDGEDFSIFELGPAIANNVIMQANSCTINNSDTPINDICLQVIQNPGRTIDIIIRAGRENHDDPVDSGEILYVLKDYVIKFE